MALELSANSLGDFFQKIDIASIYFKDLIRDYKKDNFEKIGLSERNYDESISQQILWFRGQENSTWSLTPSIMRTFSKNSYDREVLLNQEQLRIQHFSAKNTHQISTSPKNRIEWLELMQHFGTKTRLLDWSESSIYSLLFAIEPLINPNRCKKCNLSNFSPVLYVCSPQYFNMKIANTFKTNTDLLKVIDDNSIFRKLAPKLIDKQEYIEKHIELMERSQPEHLNYIYDLSEIFNDLKCESIINAESPKRYYSFYYNLLIKYYFDGWNEKIGTEYIADTLLPLCIVQPYHSERIRSQRGAFMAFPAYGNYEKYDNVYLDNQNDFVKIKIERPDIIVKELSLNGVHRSWLYPEMEIVSGEIEKI